MNLVYESYNGGAIRDFRKVYETNGGDGQVGLAPGRTYLVVSKSVGKAADWFKVDTKAGDLYFPSGFLKFLAHEDGRLYAKITQRSSTNPYLDQYEYEVNSTKVTHIVGAIYEIT